MRGRSAHEHSATWGALGIADFISSRLPEAEALRKAFEVFVLPVINPDGNVAGTTFNAEGLDLYRAFVDDPEAENPSPHECRLLWDWIRQSRPALWMNFHAYTGWQVNSEFPCHGWYEVEDRGIISDPAQRRLYDAVCDTLRLKTDAGSSHAKASLHRPDSLCYQMANRFGIPHIFYELNN